MWKPYDIASHLDSGWKRNALAVALLMCNDKRRTDARATVALPILCCAALFTPVAMEAWLYCHAYFMSTLDDAGPSVYLNVFPG